MAEETGGETVVGKNVLIPALAGLFFSLSFLISMNPAEAAEAAAAVRP